MLVAAVVVGLLVVAGLVWTSRTSLQEGPSDTAVDQIGAAAGCEPVQTEPASGSSSKLAAISSTALTHWALEGPDAVAGQGVGVRQYCVAPSGAAIEEFMQAYPWSNSPEPEAG